MHDAQVLMTVIAPLLKLLPDIFSPILISLRCGTFLLEALVYNPGSLHVDATKERDMRDLREYRLQVGISDILLAHKLRQISAAVHHRAQQHRHDGWRPPSAAPGSSACGV